MIESNVLREIENNAVRGEASTSLRNKDTPRGVGPASFFDLPPSDGSKLPNLPKKRQKRSALIFAIAVTDVLAIVCSYVIAAYIYLGVAGMSQTLNVLFCVIPIYLVIALNNKAFRTKVLTSLWVSVSRGVGALLLSTISMLLILFFFKTSAEFSRVMFALGTLGSAIFIVITRTCICRLSRHYIGNSPYADLCIYDGIPIEEQRPQGAINAKDYGLVADPNDAKAVTRLSHLASGMDRVILRCLPEKRNAWVIMLRSLDIKSEIIAPELQSISPLAINHRYGKVSLLISAGQFRWDEKLVKRVFDLIFVLASLPITLPIICIFAILVKLESPGPAFFRQERIGLGNRKFRIWKLRSMRFDLQDDKGSKLTERDDVRITKVGKFIRKTSIDEIPQIFNVLAGTMSIVGPRPHAERALAGRSLYWEVDNSYWHRHVVKPGITGLAQVRGHRGNTFEEHHLAKRLQSDLEYVRDWSLMADFRISIQTIAVLFHKNAF